MRAEDLRVGHLVMTGRGEGRAGHVMAELVGHVRRDEGCDVGQVVTLRRWTSVMT
jgi:hypothetical protein